MVKSKLLSILILISISSVYCEYPIESSESLEFFKGLFRNLGTYKGSLSCVKCLQEKGILDRTNKFIERCKEIFSSVDYSEYNYLKFSNDYPRIMETILEEGGIISENLIRCSCIDTRVKTINELIHEYQFLKEKKNTDNTELLGNIVMMNLKYFQNPK